MKKVFQFFNKKPRLKRLILKFLPNFIKNILYNLYNKTAKNYTIFNINNKHLIFFLEPLSDNRGIGRVAKEQYNYLKKNYKEVKQDKDKFNLEKTYFYSSIHWAPNDLPKNSYVMIHDVIPMVLPKLFPDAYIYWKEELYKRAQQATHIITISQQSKKDISKYLDINEDKITIINNGVTKLKYRYNKDLDKKLNFDYFVYVGAYDKHKNLAIILEAIALNKEKSYKLVMIGDNFKAKDKVKELKIEDRVIFLGKLKDEDMAFVVKKSIALLFPSLYEGFGLPPMEAALLDTPSICSNKPTMTEFLNDVALFADPNKPQEWLEAMNKLYQNKELRKKYAQLAKKRVENLTWEKSCKKLVDILV